jgi:hypothetical protein
MGQEHDSMHVGLDRMIELAELARQASPDERIRLINAFRQVAEALQEVIRVRAEQKRREERNLPPAGPLGGA